LSAIRKRTHRLTTALEDCLHRCSEAKYPKLYDKVLHELPPELRNFVYQHMAGDRMTLFKTGFHEEVFSSYYRDFPVMSKSCNDHLDECVTSIRAAGPLLAHEAAECFYRETAFLTPADSGLPLFINKDQLIRWSGVVPAHLIRNITLAILPEDFACATRRATLASQIGALHTLVNKTATITIQIAVDKWLSNNHRTFYSRRSTTRPLLQWMFYHRI
jgi:hypothetical protein